MTQAPDQTARKSASVLLVEHKHGKPVDELLRGMYGLGWTQQRIADELGVSRLTVIRWMAERGIPTRDRRRVA